MFNESPWLEHCCLSAMTREPSALRQETQLCFRLLPDKGASGCLSSVFLWPAALFPISEGGSGGADNRGGGGQEDRLTAATRFRAAIITPPPSPAGSARIPTACRAALLAELWVSTWKGPELRRLQSVEIDFGVESPSPLPSNLGNVPIVSRASRCSTTSPPKRCAGTPKLLRLLMRCQGAPVSTTSRITAAPRTGMHWCALVGQGRSSWNGRSARWRPLSWREADRWTKAPHKRLKAFARANTGRGDGGETHQGQLVRVLAASMNLRARCAAHPALLRVPLVLAAERA